MSAFLTADFVDLYSLYSDWPENAGSRVFPLFSSCFLVPPPGQVKTSLLKKYKLAKKQAFILSLKQKKKYENAGY